MTVFAVETFALTKRFGDVVAVDDLTLGVPRGSVFGLLGPNGAGKTTLIGVLLGLLAPTEGDFTVLGRRFGDEGDGLLRRIGSAMEIPSFYAHLSGRDNLRFFQGIGGGGESGEVDRLLALVGLAERKHAKVSTYSLGMKHRLGVAYSLLHDAELLLLDEPTNGLDPAGMAEVRDLIGSLADGSRTIVLASHLLPEVRQVCDHVAILSRGRVVAQGEVAELLAGAGRISLTTTEDRRAAEIVGDLDWVESVEVRRSGLLVTGPAERSWELSAALAADGVYVASMATEERSLEDYFMEVTREAGGGGT